MAKKRSGSFLILPEFRDRLPYVVSMPGTFQDFYVHLDTDVAEPEHRIAAGNMGGARWGWPPAPIMIIGDADARMKMRSRNPWLRRNPNLLGALLLTADDFGPLTTEQLQWARQNLIDVSGSSTAFHGSRRSWR